MMEKKLDDYAPPFFWFFTPVAPQHDARPRPPPLVTDRSGYSAEALRARAIAGSRSATPHPHRPTPPPHTPTHTLYAELTI